MAHVPQKIQLNKERPRHPKDQQGHLCVESQEVGKILNNIFCSVVTTVKDIFGRKIGVVKSDL